MSLRESARAIRILDNFYPVREWRCPGSCGEFASPRRMDDLTRLFQLTLYGFKISAEERAALVTENPSSWEEVLALLQAGRADRLGRETAWSKEIWRRLDAWTNKLNLRWTRLGDEIYPARLREISEPPLILSYQGEPVWRERELIAVVGSRDPRRDSLQWMRQHLLPFLDESSFTVASGGARGIDAHAHELTMLAGRPAVSFLPCGILHRYPSQNEPLFQRILSQGGALISGFAPEAEMQKGFFHARNRWIAGIAAVTLIVEAQRKSGSYLTAKMAMEEGRAICTLPVSPLSSCGLANLDLIFEGAHMLRDHLDLLALANSEC